MPPKKCGKCDKTVYPTEEMKCLDKSWHKGCFRCTTCNMTLTMKNYKGYDKLPYCNAHYPQTKHTSIADTPEQRRISQNTKIQSNRAYHKDFEENKSKIRTVTDGVEMKTHAKNTKNFSLLEYQKDHMRTIHEITAVKDPLELLTYLKNTENYSMIKYHEDFEKQKGKKITVADDPEVMRVRQNMNIISNVAYHGDRDRRQEMESRRPDHQLESDGSYYPDRRTSDSQEVSQLRGAHMPPPAAPAEPAHTGSTPYSSRNSAGARQVYDSNVGKDRVERFSSSADDDSGLHPQARYSGYNERTSRSSVGSDSYAMEQPPQRKVGSISDYDPLNERYGSVATNPQSRGAPQSHQPPQQSAPSHPPPQSYQPPPQQAYQPPPQPAYQPPPQPEPVRDRWEGKGMVCVAMYDYQAADADEVSFSEGDFLVSCQPIDAGWMEGTVDRTGHRGMLPSNYVERNTKHT